VLVYNFEEWTDGAIWLLNHATTHSTEDHPYTITRIRIKKLEKIRIFFIFFIASLCFLILRNYNFEKKSKEVFSMKKK